MVWWCYVDTWLFSRYEDYADSILLPKLMGSTATIIYLLRKKLFDLHSTILTRHIILYRHLSVLADLQEISFLRHQIASSSIDTPSWLNVASSKNSTNNFPSLRLIERRGSNFGSDENSRWKTGNADAKRRDSIASRRWHGRYKTHVAICSSVIIAQEKPTHAAYYTSLLPSPTRETAMSIMYSWSLLR
jgi:hypothetical protein